jgi:hypothetical protein
LSHEHSDKRGDIDDAESHGNPDSPFQRKVRREQLEVEVQDGDFASARSDGPRPKCRYQKLRARLISHTDKM